MSDIRILALEHGEQNVLDQLLRQWQDRRPGNMRRAAYYDSRNAVKNLGIAVPDYLMKIDTVLGWPAQGVDKLARRLHLEGFVLPRQEADPFGVDEIWYDNRLDVEAPQAHTSALIHTPAFITTTLGDIEAGEPEVVVAIKDALSGTGIWDSRRRCLSSFLSIIDLDDDGNPNEMILYLPRRVLFLTRGPLGTWKVERRSYDLDRIPVEPLVYRPRIGRPFGSSRISRPAMSITDGAMRTVLRSEVGAEFFSGPQRVLLGADESAFMGADGRLKSQWESIIGRVWAVPAPEDPEMPMPQVEQMPQVSMLPHTDHLRMFSQLIAAEFNLPVSAFGVVHDQPASAEAIHAVYQELILEAEATISTFGVGWARSMQTAVILRDDLDTVPDELRKLRSKYRDPANPSRQAATDAVVKQVQTGILLPDSHVALEALGYDQTTIERIRAEHRRARGSALTSRLTGQGQQGPQVDPEATALLSRREPVEE